MIAIGIGSNQGDRVQNIKRALRMIFSEELITAAKISPLYDSQALLPDQAPPHWNIPFLNLAVVGHSNLSPQEALYAFKKIENVLRRDSSLKWAPRPIDIDILFWNELEIKDEALEIPHPEFLNRPFALLPLRDLAPYFKPPHFGETLETLAQKWNSKTPLQTKKNAVPQSALVGILNVTPDSFSDGGKNQDLKSALKTVADFIESGTTIVDVGAESTRPEAKLLSAEEEWSRLKDILIAISMEFPQVQVSVDTRHGAVAAKALELGARFINDVSAFAEPAMLEVVKNHPSDLIFMHSLGIPPIQKIRMDENFDTIEGIKMWAKEKIKFFESRGISKERLIFDPGIGFGKTAHQNFEVLARLNEFRSLGLRILVGHSRKSFLKEFSPQAQAFERDPVTACLTYDLACQGADYIRVHNVTLNRQALESSARVRGVYL